MSESTRNPEAVRRHTKRLGRELAMQFLFSCEMRGETPGAAAFDLFFESVRDEVNLPDGRLARKGCEYAATLYSALNTLTGTGAALNADAMTNVNAIKTALVTLIGYLKQFAAAADGNSSTSYTAS